MLSPVSSYLVKIQQELQTGHAQEHSFRPALKDLFEALLKLQVVNEPKGSAHGRPDMIFVKGDLPIAWVEAKDLHVSLDKVEKSEQMARYFGYANLILTNGLEFRFFKNGKRYGESAVLAVKHGEKIEPNDATSGPFGRLLADFIDEPAETIKSAEHLAKIMGGKASRLKDNIVRILDPTYGNTKGDIESIRDVLKSKLIHDLTDEQFADLYAQTLVYGLFVARYHDETPETFSRSEARERIPASNHLLQQFFDHIAGANFERRLAFIVDELCEVFRHADVHALVHGLYQKEGDTHDPIIHFYEDFLREYNPKLRTERGVFYTPLPVVRYIVRSVDALLKEHFGLKDGLADRSTIEWNPVVQGKKSKQQIDRVQILDPAVGTGTFLNEVIRHIHGTFKGQEGSWPKFVEEHLLNRLNGFELMMASYTIAHLKLSMTLAETGVKELRKRIRIFLTNSLEEGVETDVNLFNFGLQEAITEESRLAAEVKRDLPIMVVLGNPPYSVSSSNKGEWILNLLKTYKEGLQEKSYNSLSDDYVKFIRFAHHLIEKNKQGIVAMITNNSFLDGITHRRMRESLLETFDDIYILDLHGSSKKKETAPDGSKDENVFDIQQGVSIALFVKKTTTKKTLGALHHFEIFGERDMKYAWLEKNDVRTTTWETLNAPKPAFFFIKRDESCAKEFSDGLALNNLFPLLSSGIETKKDSLTIHFTEEHLRKILVDFLEKSDIEVINKYQLSDVRDWKLQWAKSDVVDNVFQIVDILYRCFDRRKIFFSGKTKGFVSEPRTEVMRHFLLENLGLIILRQSRDKNVSGIFVTKNMVGKDAVSSLDRCTILPLYLYPDSATVSDEKRTANLNMELLTPALKKLKLKWVPDGTGDGKNTCGPEDVFDYIYAVLHCPAYRTRYKEFLKIDFPRVPFTSSAALFWQLVALGRGIRALHLLESPLLDKLRTSYPVSGSDNVEKVRFEGNEKGNVWINETQYFGDVPKLAWEFFIGGYQPAQKWLKDRKGRTLTSDDLLHYQRVIIALAETDRLMKEVDEVIKKSGGLPVR